MSTPALLAYVDELLSPDADTEHPPATQAAAPRGISAVPTVARDVPPLPEDAPAIGPVAVPLLEPTAQSPARLAQAIADKVAAATAATTAPTGRWLRMTVDSDHYAVELLRVQEVTRVAPIVAMRGAAKAVLGAMNLRGRIVPVFDLGRWLGAGEVVPDERARIVVVERNDELIGLLVTAVDDVFPLVEGAVEEFRVPGPQRRNIDRAFLGIARPGRRPTVLLDARALFD
ncbi:MAG: chemotaxis protein CheW [Luteimonas sp.]